MTPKEKAKELIEKFYENDPEIGRSITQATKCALIAVDELIKENEKWHYWHNLKSEEFVEYWQQVKTEIENL